MITATKKKKRGGAIDVMNPRPRLSRLVTKCGLATDTLLPRKRVPASIINKGKKASGEVQPTVLLPSSPKSKRVNGDNSCETDTDSAVARKNKRSSGVTPRDPDGCVAAAAKSKRRRGEKDGVNETLTSPSANTNGHAAGEMNPKAGLYGRAAGNGDQQTEVVTGGALTCRKLMELQRRYVTALRSRIQIDNNLSANVAEALGYHAGMTPEDRKKYRPIADGIIEAVRKGKPVADEHEAIATIMRALIMAVDSGRGQFDAFIDTLEKSMEACIKSLPIAPWLKKKEQRGVGLLSIAHILGECGDFSLYANPAKVWKRMGCAPFQGKMCSTWKSGKEGKLSADEWTQAGYCPRRRAIMFVIGECLVKGNQTKPTEKNPEKETWQGPYVKRYEEAKAKFAKEHQDYSAGRCHSHGMLLASKLLLKNLWIEWRR